MRERGHTAADARTRFNTRFYCIGWSTTSVSHRVTELSTWARVRPHLRSRWPIENEISNRLARGLGQLRRGLQGSIKRFACRRSPLSSSARASTLVLFAGVIELLAAASRLDQLVQRQGQSASECLSHQDTTLVTPSSHVPHWGSGTTLFIFWGSTSHKGDTLLSRKLGQTRGCRAEEAPHPTHITRPCQFSG